MTRSFCVRPASRGEGFLVFCWDSNEVRMVGGPYTYDEAVQLAEGWAAADRVQVAA